MRTLTFIAIASFIAVVSLISWVIEPMGNTTAISRSANNINQIVQPGAFPTPVQAQSPTCISVIVPGDPVIKIVCP